MQETAVRDNKDVARKLNDDVVGGGDGQDVGTESSAREIAGDEVDATELRDSDTVGGGDGNEPDTVGGEDDEEDDEDEEGVENA